MRPEPPPAPRIRTAQPADGDAVLALATAFATSFRVDPAAFRASFRELIDTPDARVLVATDGDDGVVGYVLGFVHPTFYANGPIAWVEEITVESSRRRAGIGRALMDAFEAWATDRGARLVALATRSAAAFYAALGYEDSAIYHRKLLGPGGG
jgi:GNAT superfamily N-acetyltransferase